MTKWFVDALEELLNALESIEWLFDEEDHPTLAAVENACFNYLFVKIQILQAYLTKEVRRNEGVFWYTKR